MRWRLEDIGILLERRGSVVRMSIRVYSVDIYNFKDITTVKSRAQDNIKDRFCGNYSYGVEKDIERYIKMELKL